VNSETGFELPDPELVYGGDDLSLKKSYEFTILNSTKAIKLHCYTGFMRKVPEVVEDSILAYGSDLKNIIKLI